MGGAVDGKVKGRDETENDRDHLDVPEDLVEGRNQGFPFFLILGLRRLPLSCKVPEVDRSLKAGKPLPDHGRIGGTPVAVVAPAVALPDPLNVFPRKTIVAGHVGHALLHRLHPVALAVLLMGDLGKIPQTGKKVVLPVGELPRGAGAPGHGETSPEGDSSGRLAPVREAKRTLREERGKR